MKFAATLKELREERHITQKTLAEHLKVTRSTIAGYETKGKQPDYERLIRIAKYFHVTTDYLLTGTCEDTITLDHNSLTKTQNLLSAYSRLSAKAQDEADDYIQYLEMKEKIKIY